MLPKGRPEASKPGSQIRIQEETLGPKRFAQHAKSGAGQSPCWDPGPEPAPTLQEGLLPGKSHHRHETKRVPITSTELLNTGQNLFFSSLLLFLFFFLMCKYLRRGKGGRGIGLHPRVLQQQEQQQEVAGNDSSTGH